MIKSFEHGELDYIRSLVRIPNASQQIRKLPKLSLIHLGFA